MKTLEIPEYEIDGLILTLKETGLKGWSKYMDVISLNHIIERGFYLQIKMDYLIAIITFSSNVKLK
jgi:hypothetical protein